MRLNKSLTVFFLGVCFAVTLPVYPQSSPSGEKHGFPLSVGAGFSDFNLDYGQGRRMEGITLWADYYLLDAAPVLNRLGLEVQGRDIDFGRPSSLPNMREDTFQGGLTLRLYSRKRLRVFGKFLAGTGRLAYPPFRSVGPQNPHLNNTVYSTGGGVTTK